MGVFRRHLMILRTLIGVPRPYTVSRYMISLFSSLSQASFFFRGKKLMDELVGCLRSDDSILVRRSFKKSLSWRVRNRTFGFVIDRYTAGSMLFSAITSDNTGIRIGIKSEQEQLYNIPRHVYLRCHPQKLHFSLLFSVHVRFFKQTRAYRYKISSFSALLSLFSPSFAEL